MKQPTKKELVNLLRKISSKLNEHQHAESKILKGYTLAANIPGLTELQSEILQATYKY